MQQPRSSGSRPHTAVPLRSPRVVVRQPESETGAGARCRGLRSVLIVEWDILYPDDERSGASASELLLCVAVGHAYARRTRAFVLAVA